MSSIRGWWKDSETWLIAGLLQTFVRLDRADAEALHRATPEDPDEAAAVGALIGQVAVVAAMRLALPEEHPLRKAIEELARLQQVAINERARVARQQPTEGKDT